jgi:hypothetical protein
VNRELLISRREAPRFLEQADGALDHGALSIGIGIEGGAAPTDYSASGSPHGCGAG